jgi:diphthine synthase
MLFLVGVGLSDADISLKALEVCRHRDIVVYSENYTSKLSAHRIRNISYLIGKEIRHLSRADMEDNIGKLVETAREKDIAILIGGDPLIATTHKIAHLEAKKRGVRIGIVHSSSVLTASIGESGLDFYRFGQICTIPRWSEHYKPVSFYETMERNQKSNQHSLFLLDYDEEKESSIQPGEAIRVLEESEKAYGKGIINQDTRLIMLHNLSLEGEQKLLLKLKDAKGVSFGSGPTTFVLPAKLSDTESEVLNAIFGV